MTEWLVSSDCDATPFRKRANELRDVSVQPVETCLWFTVLDGAVNVSGEYFEGPVAAYRRDGFQRVHWTAPPQAFDDPLALLEHVLRVQTSPSVAVLSGGAQEAAERVQVALERVIRNPEVRRRGLTSNDATRFAVVDGVQSKSRRLQFDHVNSETGSAARTQVRRSGTCPIEPEAEWASESFGNAAMRAGRR
jgi:hypothetical protein